MGQYQAMFNVSVHHTYFSAGRSGSFDFIPVAEAEKIFANANLVLRKHNDGFGVFFDREYLDTLQLYAQDEDEPLRLNFECVSAHENFPNFTDPSVLAMDKVLFFDSSNTDQQTRGDKNLHSAEFVSSADLVDALHLSKRAPESYESVLRFSKGKALLFDAAQTARNPSDKHKLRKANGEFDSSLLKSLCAGSSISDRHLTVGRYTDGRYTDGRYTDGRHTTVALISILVTAAELQQLSESAAVAPNHYQIRFRARETYWKYFLLGDIKRQDAFIKDLDNGTEFEFSGEVTLADERTALTFRSKQLIPLRDRTKCRFQLQEMKNGRAKSLVSRLPVASANGINREVIEGKELPVSEIYINY